VFSVHKALEQESLPYSKASARQQCVYEGL